MTTLILCGFKNCGKSTVGKALAEKLGFTFMDTDHLLESAYEKKYTKVLKCPEIYKEHGSDFFRQLESDVIQGLPTAENRILALGGGSVLNPKNTQHLKSLGKIIYLRASKDLLKQRMHQNRVPEFVNKADPDLSFEKIYEERYKIYEDIADFIIDVETKKEKTVPEIVDEIITKGKIYGQ
jgi:shikimate kinase